MVLIEFRYLLNGKNVYCFKLATPPFPFSSISEMLLGLCCEISAFDLIVPFWQPFFIVAIDGLLLLFTAFYKHFRRGSSLLLPVGRDVARKCKNSRNHLYSCLCGLLQKLQALTWRRGKKVVETVLLPDMDLCGIFLFWEWHLPLMVWHLNKTSLNL